MLGHTLGALGLGQLSSPPRLPTPTRPSCCFHDSRARRILRRVLVLKPGQGLPSPRWWRGWGGGGVGLGPGEAFLAAGRLARWSD